MFDCSSRKLTLKKREKNQIMYGLNFATLCDSRPYGTTRSGRKRVCTLPLVTRNLQALDRVVRTIGELCARRLDRISRMNVRRQGDRGFGLHSARVGKFIDVSFLLLPKSVVATRVRRWYTEKRPVVLP